MTAPGTVTEIDGEALGLAVIGLGGGRQVETDVVDPAVGFSDLAPLGQKLTKGDVIGVVHAARSDQADRAAETLRAAYSIGAKARSAPDLIRALVD